MKVNWIKMFSLLQQQGKCQTSIWRQIPLDCVTDWFDVLMNFTLVFLLINTLCYPGTNRIVSFVYIFILNFILIIRISRNV